MNQDPIKNATKSECACETCTACCESRPGWFRPGEAEKAADLLGMTLPDFFRQHLAVDWLEEDDESEGDIFLLAPALEDEDSGAMYPGRPVGTCSLLLDGKCLIHAEKPFDCATAHHDQTQQEAQDRHVAIGREWATPEAQAQVRELLGAEPEATAMTPNFGFNAFMSFIESQG